MTTKAGPEAQIYGLGYDARIDMGNDTSIADPEDISPFDGFDFAIWFQGWQDADGILKQPQPKESNNAPSSQ